MSSYPFHLPTASTDVVHCCHPCSPGWCCAALCITPRVWKHPTYLVGSASKVDPTPSFLHYIARNILVKTKLFFFFVFNIWRGWRVTGISGSLIWSETLMELIFNPCSECWWSPEGPVSQIQSPHLHANTPGIFSDLLRSVQVLKREWGAESNGKLLYLFIPSKTANLVPEFAVEDLPLGRTPALVPEYTVKDLPLGRTLWWWWYMERRSEFFLYFFGHFS